MTTAQHFALTLALTLFALLATAQAQTARLSTVNVTSDGERVHIAAQGDAYEMRVDVADEQGEVVFQSGAISGQTLNWNMKDTQGERVAAGAYLVTVTVRLRIFRRPFSHYSLTEQSLRGEGRPQ